MAFYDSIRLEKGMYAAPGKTFTQVLEELDPSANYEGSALAGLDAYQRQHHLQLWELQLLCDYRPPKQYGFPNFVGGAENPTDNLRCFFPDCG